MSLSWEASPTATRYLVRRWAPGAEFTTLATTSSLRFTDTGLINGTTYHYRVSAGNSGGESKDTEEVPGDLSAQPSNFSASPDWADEFSLPDNSPPDRSKWGFDVGPGVTGEIEYFTDSITNAQIQAGSLVITAQRERFYGADGISYGYTSARPRTKDLLSQQYGRIEARIKLPGGQGVWPAFWMLGVDYHFTGLQPGPDG